MAHISGYGGSVTFASSLNASLNRWRVHQSQDDFGVVSKGEAWTTRFFTAYEWDGEIEFNVPVAVTPAQILLPQAGLTVVFTYASTYNYTGDCNVTDYALDNPLDGPVVVTAQVMGSGALTVNP